MLPADRRHVLWVGESTPVSAPFIERRLATKHLEIDEVSGAMDKARALIIALRRGELDMLRQALRNCAETALNHGLIVVALLDSDMDFESAEALLGEFSFAKLIRVEFATNLIDVAESIARASHEVGPSCGTVTITGDLSHVSAASQLLLTRAFHDCESIQVEPLDGGFVTECALRVHGWLRGSRVGPRPMPFFVKVGTLREIAIERQNYAMFADLYIPFNLRPNLIPDRCVRGSERALIVGNFVEDAISLREALRSGQGSTAIFSLFENTLRGFRMQPFTPGNSPTTGLGYFIRNRCWAENIHPDIVGLAANFGLKRTPAELQDALVAAAGEIKYLSGPYHGDLHAGNVMVRTRDAIVIDLASADFGPLTADPAALEVSLVFDGMPASMEFGVWRLFVDQLFATLPSLRPPVPEAKPTAFSWLYRAVRELRHILIGFDSIEPEATVVLAAYLMRFARFHQKTITSPASANECRHAYALVVAEKLLEAMRPRLNQRTGDSAVKSLPIKPLNDPKES
jgi:hypothetical protein